MRSSCIRLGVSLLPFLGLTVALPSRIVYSPNGIQLGSPYTTPLPVQSLNSTPVTVNGFVDGSNSSLFGHIETDYFELGRTGLALQLDYDRGVAIEQKDILAIIRQAIADVNTKDPNAFVTETYTKSSLELNARFIIEPILDNNLKWSDVKATLNGLRQWQSIRQLWVEVHFGLEQKKDFGERGRFAQGEIKKVEPSPPPTIIGPFPDTISNVATS